MDRVLELIWWQSAGLVHFSKEFINAAPYPPVKGEKARPIHKHTLPDGWTIEFKPWYYQSWTLQWMQILCALYIGPCNGGSSHRVSFLSVADLNFLKYALDVHSCKQLLDPTNTVWVGTVITHCPYWGGLDRGILQLSMSMRRAIQPSLLDFQITWFNLARNILYTSRDNT